MEVKLDNISKNWHGFALRDINLTVAQGEYFILLGPTGAGKTLLLETIMGFHKPDRGRILLSGVDITELPPEKRGIGYVPQTCVLFPHMNVRQNIEFGLKVQHVAEDKRKQTVDKVLESIGLTSLALCQPATLSGGEKQKVSLARVLATQPKIMLLDEPLTGMDVETARDLRRELKQIHSEGKTVIHVTHNQIEGFSLGDRMGLMREGEIVQTGEIQEVISNPKNEYAAKFLGYENVYKANLIQCKGSLSVVRVGTAQLKVLGSIDTAECVIAVRPEEVAIGECPEADGSMNVLEGNVVDFVDQGRFVEVSVDAGFPLQVLVTRSTFIEKRLEIGQNVPLTIKPEAVKVVEALRSVERSAKETANLRNGMESEHMPK
ncbi:MAG: ATP-binding cassette domain-containing protein [Candidatus Bathyarchaeia archaeon]